MFRELYPLLKNRPLTITVVAVGESKLRVNVVPQAVDKDKQPNKKITSTHEKEVAPIPEPATQALTTPLCLTGTPEELDGGMVETLTRFTASHVSLQQSFDTAATAIAGAVKAIEEREKLKKEQNKAANGGKKAVKPEEEKKEEPGLPSLFTAPVAVSASDQPSAANGGINAGASAPEGAGQ